MEENKTLQTMYGMLTGVTRYGTYFEGGIRECELREANEIGTDYGIFIPQYTEDGVLFERQSWLPFTMMRA